MVCHGAEPFVGNKICFQAQKTSTSTREYGARSEFLTQKSTEIPYHIGMVAGGKYQQEILLCLSKGPLAADEYDHQTMHQTYSIKNLNSVLSILKGIVSI